MGCIIRRLAANNKQTVDTAICWIVLIFQKKWIFDGVIDRIRSQARP